MQFEAVEHGTPSGIDNYISVHGGVILYNRTREPRFTQLPKSAARLKQLMNIGVIDTCVEKNTKVAVSNVRVKYDSAE
jgi:mevalonate kinase